LLFSAITNSIAAILLQSRKQQNFFVPCYQHCDRIFQATGSFKGGCYGATVAAPKTYYRPSYVRTAYSESTQRSRNIGVDAIT